MPQAELDIILKVIDNASAEFKKVNAEAIKTVNELKGTQTTANKEVADTVTQLGTKTQETTVKTKNFGEQLKDASRQARSLRQSLFVATAALAIMIKGLNDAAEYNVEAKTTLDKFNTSLKTLSATIGVTFEPAIQGLTQVIDTLRIVLEGALTGFVKTFSFIFEYLAQVPAQYKSIFDNIKAVFTGDDPVGIVQTFKDSFQRALDVANIAADQIATKIEETRAKIATGRSISNEAKQVQNEEKIKEEAIKKRADVESKLKIQAVEDTKDMLSAISEENKAAGIIFQAINFVESVIATARAVTEALPNIPLAIAVGAIGAAKSALIASQKFAVGTPEVPRDMVAQIHKGETIIPATFAEGIRRGDLTLGGGNSSNSSNIEVNIYYPKMSKQEEVKELAGLLGNEIDKQLQYARGI